MKKSTAAAVIVLAAFMFILLNASIYAVFTRRVVDGLSVEERKNAISLSDYLPFSEGTRAVGCTSSLRFSDKDELPVLDGAAALYPVYASVVRTVYPEGCVSFDGEAFSEGSAMQFRNTLRAYKAVADGDADIIFCAAPSKDQLDYAAEIGAELELWPIGREAFVFIVNENNPVDGLSTDELRGIYTGKYKNWRELGGPNRIIDPKTRAEGSGSQTVMEHFMDGLPMIKGRPFGFLGASIGYSFRYYVEAVPREMSVKMLAVDGVSPTAENIKSGDYPHVTEFYAVCRKDNDKENVRRLLDWLLSDEGQALIEATGYVGIK